MSEPISAHPCAANRNAYPHTAEDLRRFEIRVSKTDGCWMWTGAKFSNGYGMFTLKRRAVRAHRFAWFVANSRHMPNGAVVMHSCDNRLCVNPAHLSLGAHIDNVHDRDQKNRTAKGSKSGQAKLTERDVIEIRSDQRGHMTVAREFGVARSLIQRIRQRKRWTHV